MCCSTKDRHQWVFFGFIVFVIGGVLLLQTLGLIPGETWDYFWPLVVIVVGLNLMVTGSSCCRSGDCQMEEAPKASAAPAKKAPAKKKPTAKKKK